MSRIFHNFKEANNEIRRDLAELSVVLSPQMWQSKSVFGDDDFVTRELANYLYTVTEPNLSDLSPTQPWADREFMERTIFPSNPGKAWQARPEVWEPLLERDCSRPQFSYTYGERLHPQLEDVIQVLINHPLSRQVFLSVWDRFQDSRRYETRRVPCSLGYYFQCRSGKLNITYLQRSCDFATHYQNDVYLAVRLQQFIAAKAGMNAGHFSHWLGSIHVFAKDVASVF